MTPSNADLRQFILRFFSDEELETLCFDYFPEVRQNFSVGMAKNDKAMRLIDYCRARGRLADLYGALERERPAAWRDQFGAPPVQKPSFSEETRFLSRDPRQVFISHATADAEFAHRLKAGLEAAGWRVWIAPESIRPGEKWVEAIDRGLETSGVFVVALTPEAVGSRWVRTETNAAIDLAHQDEVRFVSLDVAECRLPVLWRQFQYIPFRGSYEAGLGELLRWLDGAPVSSPRKPGLSEETRFPDRRVHEKTGIELIRVPAGPFLYGDDKKTLELPAYWIGRFPVTNAQYKRFLDANPQHRVPSVDADWAKPYNWDQKSRAFPAGKADHPVVLVSWNDAKAFCDWAELRLPSEQEWEKAARGTDGRVYPWGDEWVDGRCNTSEAGVGGTTPVGRYSPQSDSACGCADLAGNVWEWTASWYDEKQTRRVLRGGSWCSDQRGARASIRFHGPPVRASDDSGFRVAAPVDSGP